MEGETDYGSLIDALMKLGSFIRKMKIKLHGLYMLLSLILIYS